MTVPPQVLAQYSAVMAKANQTANTPFQTYSGTGTSVAPSYSAGNTGSFVAPVNSQQTQGISGVNAAANTAQPYFGAATNTLNQTQANVNPLNNAAAGLAGAASEQVNPSNLDSSAIMKYLSPYLGTVLSGTAGVLNQNNQQQQAGQLGNAITSGAFGSDRAGIAAANLEEQQNLANSQIYSGILNQGYNNALSTAQQQQGVGLQAGQANRAALLASGEALSGIGQTQYGEGANTATTLASLGTGAQSAGLQGAQAQIGAGTLEQQTQQAQNTAQYTQFLQQQSYPFQVDQFLGNLAEGTGALSGSTTTTTQPGGFFSDKRLKHSIKRIGKTYDHQPIYSYKMHGDNRTHIGLIAQDVEKKHPEAVGLSGAFKTVDYDKATSKASSRGHFAGGGVPMASNSGSLVSPFDLSAILQAQQGMYAPYTGSQGGPYGGSGGPYGGTSHVPPASGATPQLIRPSSPAQKPPSAVENAKQISDTVNSIMTTYNKATKKKSPDSGLSGASASDSFTPDSVASGIASSDSQNVGKGLGNLDENESRGGRIGLAQGGMPYSDQPNYTELNIPDTTNSQKLVVAPPLQKQQSGLDQIAGLAGDAAAIYGAGSGLGLWGAAAAAAKRGGRIGYADGGSPDDAPDGTAGDTLLFPPGFWTVPLTLEPALAPTNTLLLPPTIE